MAEHPHQRSASSGWSGSPGPTGIRIGDAEREQAVQSLGEHLRAGRLNVAEYDERLEQAFAARTEAELTPLFTDLPGGSPRSGPTPAPGRSERWARRTMPVPIRLVVMLALIAAAIIVTVFIAFPPLFLIPLVWLFVIRRVGSHRHYGSRGDYGPRGHHGPRRRYDASGFNYAGPRRY